MGKAEYSSSEAHSHLVTTADRILRLPSERITTSELENIPFQAFAVTAIHSTALGKENSYGSSLGGARIKKLHFNDGSLKNIMKEADELARDMTRKWITLYGMLIDMQKRGEANPWEVRSAMMGGGKTIIAVADYVEDAELLPYGYGRMLFEEFGQHIENLEGKHITAVDMGTTPEHMDIVGEKTRYVACKTEENGGTGDPSPTTAVGVWSGTKALMEVKGIKPETTSYAIQGAGNVGSGLVREITAEYPKAVIYVTDIDAEKVKALEEKHPQVRGVNPADFWTIPADVLMPCANPYVLNLENLERITSTGTVRVICGAANDQYPVIDGEPDPEIVRAFHEAGITVASAPLVNLGGILHLSSKWWGEHGLQTPIDHHDRTRKLVQGVGPLVKKLCQISEREGKPFEEVYLQWVTETYASYMTQKNSKSTNSNGQSNHKMAISGIVLKRWQTRMGINDPAKAVENLREAVTQATPFDLKPKMLPRERRNPIGGQTASYFRDSRNGQIVYEIVETGKKAHITGILVLDSKTSKVVSY